MQWHDAFLALLFWLVNVNKYITKVFLFLLRVECKVFFTTMQLCTQNKVKQKQTFDHLGLGNLDSNRTWLDPYPSQMGRIYSNKVLAGAKANL